MNKIGIVCICIIMVFVLSACNSAASDEEMLIVVSDPPTEESATQPEQNDPPDDENDDPPDDPPDENSDDPPFITTLRTGVYGYERHMIAIIGEDTIEGDSFVYSDGSRVVYGGQAPIRQIFDYEKNEFYVVSDSLKQYSVAPDDVAADTFFLSNGFPDYRAGIDQSGNGTADCNGETLDYIDYISGEVQIRFFIKDGDVYAMRQPEDDKYTFFLTKTYSSPPTMEYFEIPDDYELYMPSR